MPTLIPDLLYRDGAFHADLALAFDEADGRITAIKPATEVAAAEAAAGGDVVRLPGRALLPGFVNAHSHAFQRLIRGRTQWRPADASVSDFWSWREAMYAAALALEPDDVYTVSRFCFTEMLLAGITTVGEFHYLHNDPSGRPYADPAELARQVIRAARDAGIRIRLLNVCYATGGIGQPLGNRQRRFATLDLDAFMATTAALAGDSPGDSHGGSADAPLVTAGVAPHSVRAVPTDWLPALHEFASARDMPFHMHVSEQPAEVDACVAAFGRRPVELLHDAGVLDGRFTGVHATHINDAEVRMLADARAVVCACPATERDLGDGILRAVDLVRAGVGIALGTDSQTIIDMLEEMRLVEYHERLRRLERVVVTLPAGAVRGAAGASRQQGAGAAEPRLEPAPLLLDMATRQGARSLRLPVGALEEGRPADLVAVDLDHMALAGWTTETLGATLALSAPGDAIADVWVGGRAVVTDRRHHAMEETMRHFNELARRTADPS
ncbi:MAG TPA: formimidoylglutamate deiminase [Longimicrobiales bacterium]|nr:formimidoylglutamate deiminase [Longimicrobiales bacterium]